MEQLSIDIMDILQAEALGHSELAESGDDQAAVLEERSIAAVGFQRVTVSLGAMPSIAGTREGTDASEDGFKEELLAWEPVM